MHLHNMFRFLATHPILKSLHVVCNFLCGNYSTCQESDIFPVSWVMTFVQIRLTAIGFTGWDLGWFVSLTKWGMFAYSLVCGRGKSMQKQHVFGSSFSSICIQSLCGCLCIDDLTVWPHWGRVERRQSTQKLRAPQQLPSQQLPSQQLQRKAQLGWFHGWVAWPGHWQTKRVLMILSWSTKLSE